MQDFAMPENYQGSDLLTIKKIAENIRLENNKDKQNSILSSLPKKELLPKEEKVVKGHSIMADMLTKQTRPRDMRNKKHNYEKLIGSNKPSRSKRESLLIDQDLLKLNDTKAFQIDGISLVNQSLMLSKAQGAIPVTKFMFGMIYSKKTEAAIKSKARYLFKWATKMIRAWVRYLNELVKRTHQQQQKYLFSIRSFDEIVLFENPRFDDRKFDKSYFKATKEIELTSEMKKVLTLNPKQRTEEQILMVVYGLSALSAFNEYPAHLKKKLCTVAYFRQIDSRRVIIRQGHVAEYFYFIISGTASVTITANDELKTVNKLTKGCSFGELALLHHSKRTASVVSISAMQLLAIERNDFFQIFMHISSEFSKYPEHVAFIKEIPIFRHLNFDQLVSHTETCLCHFYKNLIVISINDIESEWVYVVKSGSCTVIKELRIPIQSKFIRQNTLTLDDISSKLQCYDEYPFLPMPLNDCSGNSKSKTRYLWRSPTNLKPGDYFYLKNEPGKMENFHQEKETDRNFISVFIKVADLTPKDIYGLSSVLFSQEDKVRTENMASVTLISNRAEMVLISKKFLSQKSNEDLIKDIRQSLTQYPSESVFLDNYKTRVEWEKYKLQRYHSTVTKLK